MILRRLYSALSRDKSLDKKRWGNDQVTGGLRTTLLLCLCTWSCQSRYAPQATRTQQASKTRSTRVAQKSSAVKTARTLSTAMSTTRSSSDRTTQTRAHLVSDRIATTSKDLADRDPTASSSLMWASDRIWGHLSLPANVVKKLHKLWKSPPSTTRMILYGDSHTQGGFLGGAIANELSHLISTAPHDHVAPLAESEYSVPPKQSPGWITVNHPIHNRAEVHTRGYWLRQNWLYSYDRGPFGPLGIAFITQDRNAAMNLTVDKEAERPHEGVEVSAYFYHTGQELPFCLEAVAPTPENERAPDQDEISHQPRAAQESRSTNSALTQRTCHHPNRVSQSPSLKIYQDSKLGSISIWVPSGYSARLTLQRGAQISSSLIRKRDKSRRKLKKRRARLRKRYRRLNRAELNAKLNAPSYANSPHLILPDRPSLRIFGFYVRDLKARVEVSSMGVRGATIWSPAQQGDSSLSQWVSEVNPEIIAMWYGTNTAARARTNLARYRQRYRSVVQQLKTHAPESVCLVILPPDFGRRNKNCFLTKRQRRLISRRRKSSRFLKELSESRRDRVCEPDLLLNMRKRGRKRYPVPEVRAQSQWEDYKRSCAHAPPHLLTKLISIQREIALEEGCAVYDTFSAMGKAGGIKDWACSESERWAQFDLVHLTPKGYRAVGSRIAQGLYSARSTAPLPPTILAPPDQEEDHIDLHSATSE